MTAISTNTVRQAKDGARLPNMAPVAANQTIPVGAILLRNASGLAVNGSDAANLRFLGVVINQLFPADPDDNTLAIDTTGLSAGTFTNGEFVRCVRYARGGEHAFAVSGDTPLIGQAAFLVDNNTVTADPTVPTNLIFVGYFTRPAPHSAGWFVDITPAAMATGGFIQLGTEIATLTDNTTGTADGTLAVVGDTTSNQAAVINNNFADLAAAINELRDLAIAAGIGAEPA